MPITNACFLEWSKTALDEKVAGEVHYRAVVSRSYYSAYHTALNYAEVELKIPVSSMGGSTHQKLAGMLASFKCDDVDHQRSVRRLGARISSLHSLRIRADYYLDETIQASDATSMVKNVSEIVELYSKRNTVDAAGLPAA